MAELQKDAEFFRSECLRLGQELQEVQYRLKVGPEVLAPGVSRLFLSLEVFLL